MLNEACSRPSAVLIIRALDGGRTRVPARRVGLSQIGSKNVRGVKLIQVLCDPSAQSRLRTLGSAATLWGTRGERGLPMGRAVAAVGRGHASMHCRWCSVSTLPYAVETGDFKQTQVHDELFTSTRSRTESIWLH